MSNMIDTLEHRRLLSASSDPAAGSADPATVEQQSQALFAEMRAAVSDPVADAEASAAEWITGYEVGGETISYASNFGPPTAEQLADSEAAWDQVEAERDAMRQEREELDARVEALNVEAESRAILDEKIAHASDHDVLESAWSEMEASDDEWVTIEDFPGGPISYASNFDKPTPERVAAINAFWNSVMSERLLLPDEAAPAASRMAADADAEPAAELEAAYTGAQPVRAVGVNEAGELILVPATFAEANAAGAPLAGPTPDLVAELDALWADDDEDVLD